MDVDFLLAAEGQVLAGSLVVLLPRVVAPGVPEQLRLLLVAGEVLPRVDAVEQLATPVLAQQPGEVAPVRADLDGLAQQAPAVKQLSELVAGADGRYSEHWNTSITLESRPTVTNLTPSISSSLSSSVSCLPSLSG